MIKTSALEPVASLVTMLLKYDNSLKNNSCIYGEKGILSVMLNLNILRPCEVVLDFFFFFPKPACFSELDENLLLLLSICCMASPGITV